MANSKACLGHSERCARVNKIKRMLDSPQETPDEDLRVLIKRGPNKEETSLKELEENNASKPEWKVIEGEECSASLSRSSGWSTFPNLIVEEMLSSWRGKEKELET